MPEHIELLINDIVSTFMPRGSTAKERYFLTQLLQVLAQSAMTHGQRSLQSDDFTDFIQQPDVAHTAEAMSLISKVYESSKQFNV